MGTVLTHPSLTTFKIWDLSRIHLGFILHNMRKNIKSKTDRQGVMNPERDRMAGASVSLSSQLSGSEEASGGSFESS